jgi:hypothetical protein
VLVIIMMTTDPLYLADWVMICNYSTTLLALSPRSLDPF